MACLMGKVALITGGANGIGGAIAKKFAQEGASLILVDINLDSLLKIKNELLINDAKVNTIVCDVRNSTEISRAMDEVYNITENIDILINNAGGSGSVPVLDIDEISEETWDFVLDLNLKSAFLFAKHVVPRMRERGYGRIINLSSTLRNGMVGPLKTVNARLPYATAKSAIVGFTRQLAMDLGPYGITVNALAPGLIHADPEARLTKKYLSLSEDDKRKITEDIPIGRPGTGEEIASAALFLASQGSSYVSGDIMTLTGGL